MRLIDADALIDNRSIQMNIGAGDNICIDVSDILKAPTIEADNMVKVVRCRDCTHGSQYDDGSDNYVCRIGGTKKGSGFCSEGERRKRE